MKVLIALLLFGLVPIVLIFAPFIWYGKRHGWGIQQYAVLMVVVGLGWLAIFLLFLMKAPPSSVARIIGILAIPTILYALGMISGFRALHERRDASKR